MERPDDFILLDITLGCIPPSVNNMYYNTPGNGRKENEKANDFTRHTVRQICLENRGFTIPLDTDLEFFLVCYYPFPAGEGKEDLLLKRDSDNTLKAAKDAVFAASLVVVDETGMKYKKANDNQVFDDYPKKRRGDPALLEKYPRGYSHIVLAYHGHALEILKMLDQGVTLQ